MEEELIPTYLLVVRAGDTDPEGKHVEARLGFLNTPTAEEVDDAINSVTTLFRMAFKVDPDRVGHAVLPSWIGLDGDEPIQEVGSLEELY